MRYIGVICLAAYLIFVGIATLFKLSFEGENTVLGLLAIAAGVLLLIGGIEWPAWPTRTPPPQ